MLLDQLILELGDGGQDHEPDASGDRLTMTGEVD